MMGKVHVQGGTRSACVRYQVRATAVTSYASHLRWLMGGKKKAGPVAMCIAYSTISLSYGCDIF